MESQNPIQNAEFAVTICDKSGIITFMNEKSCLTFEKYGGKSLVGKSLVDCHPEPARTKLLNLLEKPEANAYTIEKNGKKKLIYQGPVDKNNHDLGLIELSIELPESVPHFIRK
jgi:sensor histidine kinase regulating citrate/malate metabolism